VVEDGKLVQRVDHVGLTGANNHNNVYRVSLPQPSGKVELRASVRSDGGTKSNGDIYLIPAG